MLTYSPTNADIASSVFFGISSWSFNRGTFVNAAIKQYIILILANNIAVNAGIIKRTIPNSLITDTDFWTGTMRVLTTMYELGNTDISGSGEKLVSSDIKIKKVTKEIVEESDTGIEIKRTIEDEYEPEPEPEAPKCKETEPIMINGYPNKKITIDLVSSILSNILARIIFEDRKINFV